MNEKNETVKAEKMVQEGKREFLKTVGAGPALRDWRRSWAARRLPRRKRRTNTLS